MAGSIVIQAGQGDKQLHVVLTQDEFEFIADVLTQTAGVMSAQAEWTRPSASQPQAM